MKSFKEISKYLVYIEYGVTKNIAVLFKGNTASLPYQLHLWSTADLFGLILNSLGTPQLK